MADLRFRPASEADVETLFGLILELAEYEKLTDAVRGDAEVLRRSLFGSTSGSCCGSSETGCASWQRPPPERVDELTPL